MEFAHGIDVVIDYLWGESAKTIIVATAKAVEGGGPVRFVQVGGASCEGNIELPAAALRSSAIQLMGCGIKSVPFDEAARFDQAHLRCRRPCQTSDRDKDCSPLSE